MKEKEKAKKRPAVVTTKSKSQKKRTDRQGVSQNENSSRPMVHAALGTFSIYSSLPFQSSFEIFVRRCLSYSFPIVALASYKFPDVLSVKSTTD